MFNRPCGFLQVRALSQEEGQGGSNADSLHPPTARRERERVSAVTSSIAYNGNHGYAVGPSQQHIVSSTARQIKNGTSQLYPALGGMAGHGSGPVDQQQLGTPGNGSKSSPYSHRQAVPVTTTAPIQQLGLRHKPVVPSLNLAKHEGLGFGSGELLWPGGLPNRCVTVPTCLFPVLTPPA